MSYPEALIQCGVDGDCITTIDIREDSRAVYKTDYLHWPTYEYLDEVDVIITNPPFNIAMDIIKKALDDVSYGGWVIMLLRLNFFEGRARKAFWEQNMPVYAFVHHKRMSFTDAGGTDSVAYMHCCWQKGKNPDHVELRII